METKFATVCDEVEIPIKGIEEVNEVTGIKRIITLNKTSRKAVKPFLLNLKVLRVEANLKPITMEINAEK